MDNYVSHSANELGLGLLNSRASVYNENLIVSPWALVNLLSMLIVANTEKPFPINCTDPNASLLPGFVAECKCYRFSIQDKIQEAYKKIIASIQEDDVKQEKPNSFKQASLILYNKGVVSLDKNVLKRLRGFTAVEVQSFDSNNSTNSSLRPIIDKWISNNTYNVIKGTNSSKEIVSSNLLALFINANHFKGTWQDEFKDIKMKFFNRGNRRDMRMLDGIGREGQFRYAEFLSRERTRPGVDNESEMMRKRLTRGLDCKVLVLPYKMQRLSMVLLLPRLRDGVETLARKLNATVLDAIYNSMKMETLNVRVPKFDVETEFNLKEALKAAGVQEIFSDKNDLEYLFENRKSGRVTKVFGRARVTVRLLENESATGNEETIEERTIRFEKSFHTQHPFLFVIRHDDTRIPLYMGRVSNI